MDMNICEFRASELVVFWSQKTKKAFRRVFLKHHQKKNCGIRRLRDKLIATGDEIRGWEPYTMVLHFFVEEIWRQKFTFSWDPCIGFARAYEENPVEETCMDIFSSTISRRIWHLSKIKDNISAKNCILQRVLKSERIWSNFCTNLISVVLRFKKCVS